MSEPKFTEGPLEVIKFGPPSDDLVHAQFFIRAKDAPGGTALIIGGLGKEEERANADLYAAAPDMYEALTNLLKAAQSVDCDEHCTPQNCLYAAATAALAKAAGVK